MVIDVFKPDAFLENYVFNSERKEREINELDEKLIS